MKCQYNFHKTWNYRKLWYNSHMKKLFLILFLSIFTVNNTFAVQIILKPNLNVQMKKQEWVNKEKIIIERKLANTAKLRNIRANKKTGTTIAKVTETTPRITLKDKILAGKSSSVQTTIIGSSTISTAITPGVTQVAGVDMNRVRWAWLGFYNSTRRDTWLSPYSYDTRLDNTAHSWNVEFAKWRWLNHHRRNPSDSYYSYSTITEWFKSRGVIGKVAWWSTTTENVGYGYYSCNSSDCTDSLISSIRTTYEFYMSEKWRSYDAHYKSIVQPYFTKIGLDIIVVPEERRYYLTVHYITDFE